MKILKFGAVWCLHCIVMKQVWSDIEKEMPELDTQYIDIDEDAEQTKQYNITDEIPVFIFLDDNNKEFARLTGQMNKKDLMHFISEQKNKKAIS